MELGWFAVDAILCYVVCYLATATANLQRCVAPSGCTYTVLIFPVAKLNHKRNSLISDTVQSTIHIDTIRESSQLCMYKHSSLYRQQHASIKL